MSQTKPVAKRAAKPANPPEKSITLGGKLVRVIIVAALSFVPLMIVGTVLGLRADYAQNTVFQLEQSVGGRQAVFDPIIIVPTSWAEGADQIEVVENGRRVLRVRQKPEAMIFVPETAKVGVGLETTLAEASVYSAIAYEAGLSFDATFDFTNHPPLAKDQVFEWDAATLIVYLGNTRSVRVRPELMIGEERLPLYASLGLGTILTPNMGSARSNFPIATAEGRNGFSAQIGELIDPNQPLSVSSELQFGGATKLRVAPIGRDTQLSLIADGVPTALNDFRAGSIENFQADEEVTTGSVGPYSTLPQSLFQRDLSDRLLAQQQWEITYDSEDARPYEDLFRALRYGFFLLGFSFLTLFIFDASSSRALHPGQYFLLGLIQSVFYAFLLAVAEFTGFGLGFIIAAVPTVLITGYTIAQVFRSFIRGVVGVVVFGAFYAVQYFLMDKAEYSLLVATAAAFGAIGVSLLVTARLDWDKFEGTSNAD